MSDRPSPRALRFAEFVLDVPAYELRKRGKPVRLERLAMDLLILLVDRQGELVMRTDIVDRLWGRDVFLEVDASVNTLVRKIRRVLGDAVDDPRFIQTVQGKGYRFIAPVEVESPPPVPPDPEPDQALQPPAELLASPAPATASGERRSPQFRLPGRLRLAGAFVAIVLAVLAGRWGLGLVTGTEVSPVTVAVMPFEFKNLSGASDREYLTDGLTDETAASLGQIIDPNRVTVIGRMATRAYKGTTKSPAQIGRELGAPYLVVGSMQAENDRLRITSSLIRARDQVTVWADSYEREPVSMLAMQQELGAAVAQQIRLRLSSERLDSLAHRQTRNADAYDRYLKGRFYWNQLTPLTTRSAMAEYQRATFLDPNYALAWSGIADAFTIGPISADVRPSDVRAQAHDAAERALRTGAMLAEAQTSAAAQQFFLEWQWGAAETGLRRALQIDPSYALAHRVLGVVLSHSNRPDEARNELRRARELEPGYAMHYALSAMAELHAGDSDAAVRYARHALAIDPEFWIAHYHLAQAYEQLGRTELALEELVTTARLSQHGNSKAMSVRGYILAKAGRRSEAADVLSTFEDLSATRYVPPYARALVYAGLGDRDATFAWLDKAFAERDVHLVFLPVDPKWNLFRNDPRFQDLLRRCDFARGAGPARS